MQPTAVAMILFTAAASPPEPTSSDFAVYGVYCFGCAVWKKNVESDSFFRSTVKSATTPPSAFRVDFIPWPTASMLRAVAMPAATAVIPISREKNLESELTRFVDFSAPFMGPLVTTKRLVLSYPSSQKNQLSEYDLSKHWQHEEQSFFLLFLVIVVVAEYVFRHREKQDKLSSDQENDILELVPTINDEEEEEELQDLSEVVPIEASIKSDSVESISDEGKRKCVVNKAAKRVQFTGLLHEDDTKSQRTVFFSPKQEEGCTKEQVQVTDVPQEEDSKSQRTIFFSPAKGSLAIWYKLKQEEECTAKQVHAGSELQYEGISKTQGTIFSPLRYTCNNNNFQDKVSVEILKYLLRMDGSKKKEKEEEPKDTADVATTQTVPHQGKSCEDESIVDLRMINKYEDFLKQVRQWLH